jgi:hypothetical protein
LRALRWLVIAGLAAGCGADATGGGAEPTADPGGLPGPDNNDNLYPVSSLGATEGALYQDVAADAGYVYGCTGNAGLTVAARAEDWSLSTIATVALPDAKGCRAVTTSMDGGVFVTGQSDLGGSYIAEIGAGTGTVLASLHLPTDSVESIEASATHVFVMLGESGIKVLGRNDGALAEVGALPSGFDQALGAALWYGAAAEGETPTASRLIVANGLSGLAVVDISDPAAPSIVSTNKTYGTARRVVMRDDTAYVAQAGGGISALDMSSDSPFPPLSSWSTHGSSVDVAIDPDGNVFVANLGDLCVLDGSDPTALTLTGSERIPAGSNPRVVGVAIDAGAGYAAEWNGLWTYGYAAGLDAADIHLTKNAVDFGLVSLKKGKGIIVTNLGNDTLEIDAVAVVDADGNPHPDFQIEVEKNSFPPGDKGLLELTFEPVDDSEVQAWAELSTNDPDEPLVRIPLTANMISGYQVGAPFDPDGELVFSEYKTGNDLTVKGQYSGSVVLLVWFASW